MMSPESSESYPEPERGELEPLEPGAPGDATGELPADLQPAGRGGVPRRFVLRFLFLVALIVTGFALLRLTPLAGLLQEGALVAAFERLRASPWAPVALVLSYVLLCPFGVPATPMMIAGGVIFGVLRGGMYNLAGTFLGGAATFFMARHL